MDAGEPEQLVVEHEARLEPPPDARLGGDQPQGGVPRREVRDPALESLLEAAGLAPVVVLPGDPQPRQPSEGVALPLAPPVGPLIDAEGPERGVAGLGDRRRLEQPAPAWRDGGVRSGFDGALHGGDL